MEHTIPQYLHRPVQFLWFELDELVSIVIGYIVGFLLGGWWWSCLLIIPYVYIKFRRRMPRGFLLHIQYMAGLMQFKGYPHYFQRKFGE